MLEDVLVQRHRPAQLGAIAPRDTWCDFLLREASKFWGFPPRQQKQAGWQELQATLLMGLGSPPPRG